MAKRVFLFVVLAVLGWSGTAMATLTADDNPVAMGNVVVDVSKTLNTVIRSDGTDNLDHFVISPAACGSGVLTVVPKLPDSIPRPIVTLVSPMTLNVTFTPAARGALTCLVTMQDSGNVELGSFGVTGTGIAPIINPPATADLGSIRFNNAVTTHVTTANILIGNTGDSPLTITNLAISGTNATEFTITSAKPPPNIVVQPGNTTPVTIQFDPTAAGTRTAKLDITSDDPATPSVSVNLSGVGLAARIAVTDISFGAVAFGSFADNTTSVTNAETTNPGPLKLTTATISGTGFSFNSNGGACTTTTCTFSGAFTLSAPATISVRCQPTAAQSGTITGTVTVNSDTDAGGDGAVGLSCDVNRADAHPDVASIDFGTAVVVGTTVQKDVNVKNDGNIDLVYNVGKTGARAGEYTLSGCVSPCTVTAGNTQTFTVSFTPTAIGAANISVNIASNDPDGTIAIPVTASSVAPQISAPATLQFNSVEVLSNSNQTLTVTNTGGADMTISSANFGTNPATTYSLVSGSTGTQTVTKNGGQASWDIKCTPATQGAKDGTFVINSDAFVAPHVTTVQLRCNGTEGILAITAPSPASIDFGGVAENTTRTLTFTLKNTGNLTVSNIAATVTPNNVGYSFNNLPTSLIAGASQVVNVVFAPLSGTDGGPATVDFTGTWGTGNKPLQNPPQLALDGDGLTAAFDVSPTAIAFGDIRFDKTATQTFCITNTNTAGAGTDINIQTITIAPAAGTTSGEFSVPVVASITHVRRKQCMAAGAGVDTTLPTTIAAQSPAQQLEVTVTVAPNNRTGPMAATLTVTSNLASPNTTRTVALSANSTSATLAIDPGNTVDFGTVDIQGTTPPIRTITITNTGDAALDLGSFARSDGGANTHFSFTLPSGVQSLAKNQSVAIAVTYTPTVVTIPNESINITHTIAGDIQAPANATITLTGKAIDREIDITASPVFPDTFRNPGADAPVRPVTVTNTGQATLHVTAAMVSSADPSVWTLVDQSPQDIPGGTSFDFLVKFAPTSVGIQPTGTLTLTNDDSSESMAEVEFNGNGIDRNVAFGAQRIDVGFTGIGVPVVIHDALLVASMNASTTFRITRIDIADADPSCIDDGMITNPSAFALEDPPNGDELAASAQRTFDLAFSADSPGHFVASAELFIDSDPVPQAKVCVEGTAVFVDAHGGGGCSTGGASGGGAIVLIGLAFVLRRRRRAGLAVLAILVVAPAARADKLAISIFDPTPSLTPTYFQLQSAEVGLDGAWVATAILSNATDPLTLDASENGAAAVLQRSTMLEVGGAYAFLGRFEAGAHMPFFFQAGAAAGDPQMMFTADPANGAAMGDLTMHGKARLWKRGGAAVSAAAQLTLPTANDDSFTGTDKPSLRALGLASLVPDTLEHRISLSAQLGVVGRAKSKFANIEQGSGATWGLGLSVRALDSTYLAAEMFGDTLPAARKATATTSAVSLSPIEWLAGVRWFPDRRVSVGIAVGRGLTSAAGSPALRGVLELSYSPAAPEITPIRIPRAPKPDLDADGDGILDSVDKCPNEPEDKDLFDDADGCPDPDNDKDGVPDVADKCPLDAEDKDGFEDADGCPDKDNDKDGIPDAVDKCPNDAEDKDGFEDLDGCPDLDNDHDGIEDSRDKCPLEAETINGNKDDDGCPDPGDSAIVLSPDRIETLDAVQFERRDPAKIAKSAYNLLGQVGSTMRAHPEIVRMRVTCHVNPTGNYEKDQELSDKRAASVRDWLVQWGIDAKRVEARGFGSTKPLAPADQKNAASINDRIELIILERK